MTDDSPASACPQLEALDAYARGDLPGDAVEAIIEHLENCQMCREAVTHLEYGERCAEQLEGSGTLTVGLDDDHGAGATTPKPIHETSAPYPPPIPDYVLERRLAKGGFGEVWLARSHTGVYHAIKILTQGRVSDIEFSGVESFSRHGNGHENLIQILHVGRSHGFLYYVMELADGYELEPTFSHDDYKPKTLRRELKHRGTLPVDEAVSITRQVLNGLGHLHQHDLLHRDVKPNNVVFVKAVAKLADVGLLTHDDERNNSARTPGYSPPEGVLDRSGDLYCVGNMLSEMLTGHRSGALEKGVDPQVERFGPLIEQACAEKPDERFSRAEEFLEALDVIAPQDQGSRPWPTLVWVAVAVFGVVVTVAVRNTWVQSTALPASEIKLLYKNARLADLHFTLMPNDVPLRAGQTLKFKAEWGVAAYPVVVALTDHVEIAYPAGLESQRPLEKLELPHDEVWFELEEGDQTITFLLLLGSAPVENLEALVDQIASLGEFPTIDPDTMLRITEGDILKFDSRDGRVRGLDVDRTVRSEPGFLEKLQKEVLVEGLHLSAGVTVPYVHNPE